MSDLHFSERAARLKSLASELSLDPASKESLFIKEMLSLLSDMAEVIEQNDDDLDEMAVIVNYLEEQSDDEDDEYSEDGDEDYDGTEYDLNCPHCDRIVSVDYDALDGGFVRCPNCGERIDFHPPLED
jgi:DNA-directed RNA polymerase subunit RPC12/RpoP